MKHLFLIAIAVFAATSHASLPLDKATRSASLTERDAQGKEIGIGLDKFLVEYKWRGKGIQSKYVLNEEVQAWCVTAPCPPIKQTTVFNVERFEDAGCGSKDIIAVEQRQGQDFPFPARRLTVTDHTTRLCDDLRPNVWEVKLNSYSGTGIRTRNFEGNPRPLFSR